MAKQHSPRAAHGAAVPKRGAAGKPHSLRLPDKIWDAWQRAARDERKSLTQWLIDIAEDHIALRAAMDERRRSAQ